MSFLNYKNYYYLVFFLPIFFINNIWDGSIINYGFDINNLDGVKNWYWESSSNFQYYIIYSIYFLKKLSNLPSEFLFDTFTLIILYLFCLEICKYFKKIFNFNSKFNKIFFVILITFPTWNFLTEFNLSLYLFCFYLAILGYNLFLDNLIIKKIFGILLIILSFSIKSNFALIAALSLINFVIDKRNYKQFIFILLICVFFYFINTLYFPPYGQYEGYNQLDFSNLKLLNYKVIFDYLSFVIFYFSIPIVLIIFSKIKNNKFIFFSNHNLFNYFSLILFSCVSLGPYYLLQKSTDIFNFINFDSRHVFSLAISISLGLVFFIIIMRKFYSEKIIGYLIIIILIQNISILSSSFFAKYNWSLINNSMIKNFSKLEEPKPGNILIVSEKNFNYDNTNYIFFKAFSKSTWNSKVIGKNEFNLKQINNYFKSNEKTNKEEYKIKYSSKDYKYQCLTVFEIKKEINSFDLIKNLYIFNKKKFFKINKLTEFC